MPPTSDRLRTSVIRQVTKPCLFLDESLGDDSDAKYDVDGLGDPFSVDSSSDCED